MLSRLNAAERRLQPRLAAPQNVSAVVRAKARMCYYNQQSALRFSPDGIQHVPDFSD
jgi:hypothetical protein